MKGNSEIEIVFYVKIGDFDGLKQANEIEEHIQIEARLNNDNKIRIRKTTSKGNTSYVFTAKKKQKNENTKEGLLSDSIEYEAECSEELMEAFEPVCEQKIIKTRYKFFNRSIKLVIDNLSEPIEFDNFGFEVDVFKSAGKISEYAKVDVEINEIIKEINNKYPNLNNVDFRIKASQLPFKPLEIIYPPNASSEQNLLIQNLWETEFSIRPGKLLNSHST